jgi:hypothetical protein
VTSRHHITSRVIIHLATVLTAINSIQAITSASKPQKKTKQPPMAVVLFSNIEN